MSSALFDSASAGPSSEAGIFLCETSDDERSSMPFIMTARAFRDASAGRIWLTDRSSASRPAFLLVGAATDRKETR